MTWQPASDQHAIERVRVVVQFERPISLKRLKRLSARVDERRVDLGLETMNVHEGQAITLQMGPTGPVAVQQPEPLSGWDFRRFSAQGVTTEVLSLVGAALTFETMDYSRWPNFRDRFTAVAQPVLDELLPDEEVAVLAWEYHDRFWFEGLAADARPIEFLKLAPDSMPAAVLASGDLWHLHRGWFEPGEFGRLLLQQNIDVLDDGPKRIIRILTRAEARKGAWTIAEDDLGPHLEIMHDRTKAIFAELISDEMRQRVGIPAVEG